MESEKLVGFAITYVILASLYFFNELCIKPKQVEKGRKEQEKRTLEALSKYLQERESRKSQ